MPWIKNCDRRTAEEFDPPPRTVVVSITEPDSPPVHLSREFLAGLRVHFHDVTPEKPDKNAEFRCMRPEQARLIADFARWAAHHDLNILVHCHAGVNRSGSVVEAILEAFPQYEDRGFARFGNPHVKRLMKRALGLVPLGAESEITA